MPPGSDIFGPIRSRRYRPARAERELRPTYRAPRSSAHPLRSRHTAWTGSRFEQVRVTSKLVGRMPRGWIWLCLVARSIPGVYEHSSPRLAEPHYQAQSAESPRQHHLQLRQRWMRSSTHILDHLLRPRCDEGIRQLGEPQPVVRRAKKQQCTQVSGRSAARSRRARSVRSVRERSSTS
jgi:hypothetical protein